MRWARYGMGVVVAVVACNGDPGDPEVRLGAGELQFIRSASGCQPGVAACPTNVLADYYLTNPYYNWSISADQLKSVSLANGSNGNPIETSIDAIPLDEAPSIQMRYRGSTPISEQDEIIPFARDPEELYATLLNDLDAYVNSQLPNKGFADMDWWHLDLAETALPQGLGLSYPQQFIAPFGFITTSLPTRGSVGFFDIPATLKPSGPGALPDGSGSVKAVRIVQHGRCSREASFATGDNILGGFLDGLNDAVFAFISAKGATPIRQLAAAIPFLHQTEDREDSQWGGFFLTSEYTMGLPLINDVHARAADPYVFQLLDGIVTVQPEGAIAQVNGGGNAIAFSADAEQIHWFLDEFLDTPFDPSAKIYEIEDSAKPASVAQAFYQTFDYAQGVPTNPDDPQISEKCDLRWTGAGWSRTIPFSDPPSVCGELISPVWKAAPTTPGVVSPPLSADEQLAAKNAIGETIPDPLNVNATVWKNFRCSPVYPDGTRVDPNDPSKGVCEVVARAKRINTYPNSLELVFFDDEREVTAEAYSLFVYLTANRKASKLCSRRPANSITPRPFEWVYRGPAK